MTSFVHGLLPPYRARPRVAVVALALVGAALLGVLLATAYASRSPGVPRADVSGSSGLAPRGAPTASPAGHGSPIEVIVQLRKGVRISQGRALVRSLGGKPGVGLRIINGLSARVSPGEARRLAASPLVHAVSVNARIQESTLSTPPSWSLATTFNQSIGTTRLWSRSTGRGVGVAVIDSGVDGDLPDFRTAQGDSTSRVVASAVVDSGATTTAQDTYGHGTAVGGLVAGNGASRDSGDPVWGQYAGSAPDANLISVKVADDTGHATTLDAIAGLQFVVDHKADYNIRVVNLSFRSTSAQSYKTDPLDAAVEQAWFDGITVVAAAGNLGTAPDAVSYAPGNDPYVITVGATDDQGTRWVGDDAETSWSSQGVTQDGFSKPDVLAPGAHLVTTLAPNSAFAGSCPTCIVDGAYFQVSGTSLAAPIVAGAAADLLAAHPDWTPGMVKGAIVNTAASVAGGGVEVQAWSANWATSGQLVSNQNLTPNQLLNPDTGTIDYSTASWSTGNWTPATDPLTASWSTASWSCESCTSDASDDVNPTTASWSNVGWATYMG